jgi:hypothetical protein
MTRKNSAPNAANELWWNTYRKTFPAALIAFFEAEARATTARVFSASAFPVPLQDPDYAEAVLRAYADNFAAEQIEQTIEIREIRRATYFRGGLEASFIVDASVLRRPAGSNTIMMKQRAWARELQSTGRASIRVLDGFYYGHETSFWLLSVAGEVLAFEDKEHGLVQVDDNRRDELFARFTTYSARAGELSDHPLMRLPE